jgi:hypothetical protein
MPKRPARLYDAQFMADAVQAHAQLQSQAMKVAPHAFGPMSRIPMTPAAEEIETFPAHCFSCKGKSEFDADPAKEKVMKNGAIMKQGKCKGDGCGQTLTRFVSAKEKAAA